MSESTQAPTEVEEAITIVAEWLIQQHRPVFTQTFLLGNGPYPGPGAILMALGEAGRDFLAALDATDSQVTGKRMRQLLAAEGVARTLHAVEEAASGSNVENAATLSLSASLDLWRHEMGLPVQNAGAGARQPSVQSGH